MKNPILILEDGSKIDFEWDDDNCRWTYNNNNKEIHVLCICIDIHGEEVPSIFIGRSKDGVTNNINKEIGACSVIMNGGCFFFKN